MPISTFTSPVEATAEALFAWHARPGAFDRLNPPWDPVTVRSRTATGLEVGTTLELAARVGPATVSWTARHTVCEPPRRFVDEQVSGPFASWRHEHRFEDGALTDAIDWTLPGGALGRALAARSVSRRIARAFAFRHRRTADDLLWLAPYADRPRMRVVITGASGFVGADLAAFLDAGGHDVVRLSTRSGVDPEALRGADAVVHLAGEPIAGRRWTEDHKKRVLDSRVEGTRALCRALAALEAKPGVLVCASASGWYGDRGDELLLEDAPRGGGFLADVCEAWEAATAEATDAGIRVVNLRIGLVIGARGGALATMLPAFRAGLGGPMGSGTQWQSWIAVDDLVAAIWTALVTPALSGPVNGVGPEPVRQRDFAATLGRVLGRPAALPTPRAALAAALGGQAAEELLLYSQRIVPSALLDAGFAFRYPSLEGALRHQLGKVDVR